LIHLYVDDIDAVSEEFGAPVDEQGLAGRECDLEDTDGNRLPDRDSAPLITACAFALLISAADPVVQVGDAVLPLEDSFVPETLNPRRSHRRDRCDGYRAMADRESIKVTIAP
jgi:hypothetical protein